jgi:hypothetical protein
MSINKLLNLSKERVCYMFQKGINFHSHSRNGYSLHTPTKKTEWATKNGESRDRGKTIYCTEAVTSPNLSARLMHFYYSKVFLYRLYWFCFTPVSGFPILSCPFGFFRRCMQRVAISGMRIISEHPTWQR